jgi:protein PsiE
MGEPVLRQVKQMTALTRLLISHVQAHDIPDMGIVLTSGAILVLAFATLVIRFGSSKFPAATSDDHRKP